MLGQNFLTPLRLLALTSLVTILVYHFGLNGGFIHDDYVNIVNNEAIHLSALRTSSFAQIFTDIRTGDYRILSRPLAQITFALNYYFSGLNPHVFKATNLAIHLLTGWVIFYVLILLLQAFQLVARRVSAPESGRSIYWVAAFAASLWLIHPLNISTVLYPVQRMAQLSALFTLLGYGAYLQSRLTGLQNASTGRHIPLVIGLFIFWPLGILSKENAAILPVLCLITEVTLLRFTGITDLLRWLYRLFGLASVAILIYVLFNPGLILGSYAHREFSLDQRLMTESRVLWGYMHSIVLPNIRQMGIYLDDIPLSRGLMQPVSTAAGIVALATVLLSAVLLRNRVPMWGFSVLWFLAGHAIESSFIGLEIAYEHRNYLPSVGIYLGIAWGAAELYRRYSKQQRVIVMATCSLFILLAGLSGMRSSQWSSESALLLNEVRHHPESYRANSAVAKKFMLAGYYDDALHYALQAKNSERPHANIYFILLDLKHLRHQALTDDFYREAAQALATAPVYISILNTLASYITDAENNHWESAEQLLVLTQAMLHNPYLTGAFAQANLHLVLAKLYSDQHNRDLLAKHAEKAYGLMPKSASIAKVYAMVLINRKQTEKARTVLTNALAATALQSERQNLESILEALPPSPQKRTLLNSTSGNKYCEIMS